MFSDLDRQRQFSTVKNEYLRLIEKYGVEKIPDTIQNRFIQSEFLGLASILAIKIFKETNVSDTINMTYEEDEVLCDIVKELICPNKDIKQYKCPADIIFSKTVPIRSIEIIVDEREKIYTISDDIKANGFICKYSIKLADNYTELIDTMQDTDIDNTRVVGVGYYEKSPLICYPLIARYGVDAIQVMTTPFDPKNLSLLENDLDTLASYFISDFLSTWYAIQISMLNPATKELFNNPKVTKYPIKPNTKNNKTQKRKIGYKRTYIINKKDLEKALYGGDRKINRKCLCWYVIGHWREYQNGKKIFVQGYWKGALRETKKNHDEGREREVDINVG